MTERFFPRVLGLAALALLTWALFRIFAPFLVSILWAALLALLLEPLNLRLRRRLRGRASLSAAALTLAAALGIAIPGTLLAMVFSRQVIDLLGRVTAIANRYQISTPADVLALPAIRGIFAWIESHTPITGASLQDWLIEGAKRLLQMMASSGGSAFVGALGALAELLLTLFVLYFFLRGGDTAAERLIRVIPMPLEQKTKLVGYLASVTRAVVFGTLLTALVQGTLIGIAFAIIGFPSPVVFGVLGGAASLLPVGGTALVWGPGALVLAFQGRWVAAIGLAVYGALFVSLVDNILRPALISGRAEIATLPVFFGVLGGIGAFGPIGMFVGPVIVALALALVRFAEEGNEKKVASTA
ncbi:MAG TPA: AI-2E family transporter [Thermoanaerobaculia bacterium]